SPVRRAHRPEVLLARPARKLGRSPGVHERRPPPDECREPSHGPSDLGGHGRELRRAVTTGARRAAGGASSSGRNPLGAATTRSSELHEFPRFLGDPVSLVPESLSMFVCPPPNVQALTGYSAGQPSKS